MYSIIIYEFGSYSYVWKMREIWWCHYKNTVLESLKIGRSKLNKKTHDPRSLF